MGDFNGRIGHHISDCDKEINVNGDQLLNFRDDSDLCILMHASKGILNLPTSSLHLCSPFQQNRKVKIHHQFTSFPKQSGKDSPPRK